MPKNLKQIRKQKLRYRIRKKINGTTERPRLIPTITNKRIYLQIIDDTKNKTIAAAQIKGKNMKAAIEAGKLIAEKAKEKKIKTIVFDRGSKLYHGVIKTISQEAKKAGLQH